MRINRELVLKFLPHRDPFLFIDAVESINRNGEDLDLKEIITVKDSVGVGVTAHYRTKAEHPIFAGHFPGNPILPGVVQVEMMAQGCSFILTNVDLDAYEKDMDVALLSVEKAKFRKPILPEMDLVIKTVCTKTRGPFMSHDCQIFHNGELMSEASVMATVKLS